MKTPETQSLKEYFLKNGRDKSYNELAAEFNIKDKSGNLSGEKVRSIWRRLKIERVENSNPNIKVIEENGKNHIEYSSKEITSLEDLIEVAGVNIDFWDVTSFRVSTWQDFKDETKYAVRATFDQTKQVREKIREEFIEEAKKHAPKYRAVAYPDSVVKEKIAYEINLPDLHLGKLGWGEEVGENYDVNIAKQIFITAVNKLLAFAKHFYVEKIIFPIGNDLLNSDGLSMTTTKGTPQHDDVRWQRSFTLCRQMLVEVIDKLRLIAPVDVIIVPGNHDYERMFYIGDVLYAWYNNCDEVNVNNAPSPRKYITYGKTLLGFTHGNNEKHADLPLIMAKEMPKEWAEADYTEWHTGHLHKSKSLNWVDIDERFGTIVRILPSLSGTDSWHHEKGYVGNIRSAQAYAWSKEYGYRGQFQVNLKEIQNG